MAVALPFTSCTQHALLEGSSRWCTARLSQPAAWQQSPTTLRPKKRKTNKTNKQKGTTSVGVEKQYLSTRAAYASNCVSSPKQRPLRGRGRTRVRRWRTYKISRVRVVRCYNDNKKHTKTPIVATKPRPVTTNAITHYYTNSSHHDGKPLLGKIRTGSSIT